MSDTEEIREFLVSRRAKVDPEQVGLPAGDRRRVPGLRRGEAAALAGVSVEYYARLERGALAGASPAVLDGLATALLMDDAEREHLYRLAGRAGRSAHQRPKPAPAWKPSASLQWFLDSVGTAAALVGNGRTDLLAWNDLGRALMDPMIQTATASPPNFSQFVFLEPVARQFFPDWEAAAAVNVAQLRTEAGRVPHDKDLHDLVGELSTRSDHFRRLWARHDVWHHQTGTKRFHHPAVGDLTLHFDGLDLVGQPAIQLTVLTAEPGTRDHEGLQLLGALSATDEQAARPSTALGTRRG